MRYAIPFNLEKRLCNRFGFTVENRKFGESITFVKNKPTTKKAETIYYPGLNDEDKRRLEGRCDSIVDFFADPYKCMAAVRQRLHNLAQSQPLAGRQYVLDFIEENFPESGKKKESV